MTPSHVSERQAFLTGVDFATRNSAFYERSDTATAPEHRKMF